MRSAAVLSILLAVGCAAGPAPAPRVVQLVDEDGGLSSGVVIADDWVLTAAHVLPVVIAGDHAVEETHEHPLEDLALLRVPGARGSIQLGPEPSLHQPLSAWGYQLGATLLRTDGYQGSTSGSMSCSVVFGSSGGAVTDSLGRLVGVTSMMSYAKTWNEDDSAPAYHVAWYALLDVPWIKGIMDR